MHWLIVSDLNTSLEDYVSGRPITQGTPAPAMFVDYLCNRGDRVTLVLPRRCSDESSTQAIHPNLSLVRYQFRTSWRRLLGGRTLSGIIGTVMRNDRPDLMYSSGYESILATFQARLTAVPCFTRMYGTFLNQLFDKQRRSAGVLAKLLAELAVLKTTKDGLILTDDGTQGDSVCDRLGIAPSRRLFIRNGIEKQRLSELRDEKIHSAMRAELDLASDDFVVASVSRLAAWKRIDLVITAFDRLAPIYESLPRKPVLLIAGSGSQDQINRLREQAARSPLAHRIRFLGKLDRQDTLRLLRCSDLATSFYEVSNVGNVLLEAMQLGTVVVARNNGDTGNVISGGGNGFLLPDDPQLLVSEFPGLVERLQRDWELAARISDNGLRWCDQHLMSWESRFAEEYDWIQQRVCRAA